jgi:hypothetical protein
LLVTLRSVGDAFGLGDWTPFHPAAPELERLRDAYLEPWSDRLSRPERVRLVRVAGWTGMLARALIWTLGMRHATDAELTEWDSAVPAWLTELLNNAPD